MFTSSSAGQDNTLPHSRNWVLSYWVPGFPEFLGPWDRTCGRLPSLGDHLFSGDHRNVSEMSSIC